MLYLFDYILCAFWCSEYCWEYIWFITWTVFRDIIGLNSNHCYFPTYEDSLFWNCILASRKLHHNFIPSMLTHLSNNTSPKTVVHVRIFQIFPLTWYILDCVHVVLKMFRGHNRTFPLRLTLRFLNCMSKLFGKIDYSILS